MSYELRTDLSMKAGLDGLLPQAVFRLDSGDNIAVNISLSPTPAATLACAARAWLVDEDGDLQAVDGSPVATRHAHAADVQQITALGAQGIAAALRDLLLGEAPADPPAIPWAEQLREQVSIRNVIAVANAAGTPIDWSAP